MSTTLKYLLFVRVLAVFFSCKKDDPCDDITCLNEGVCNDGTCECIMGYEGETCETESRTKHLGTYSFVSAVCDDPDAEADENDFIITAGPSINEIVITSDGEPLIVMLDGNTFSETVTDDFLGTPVVTEINGVIDGDTMTITLKSSSLIGDITCTIISER